jgi:hypothetical protein
VPDGSKSPACELANTTVLASAEDLPRAIAIDEAAVYWTNSGNSTLRRCAFSGCPEGPETLVTDAGTPFGIALDSTFFYWTESASGRVMAAPK